LLAQREAAVQGWCADHGYAAPRVLVVLEPGDPLEVPAQVMERVPGTSMLAAMTSRPWRTGALLDRLAALHLQLHALEPDGWPGHGVEVSLADRRLSMPRAYVPQLDDPELTAALDRAEDIALTLGTDHPSVCHGDLHPLNVMVDGPRSSVIDWTDAALGDRHGDVSRTHLLFHVAAIAATSAVQRSVLRRAGPWMSRRFLRAYEAGHPLDADRLRRWEALHLVHGWTQVAALHAGLLDSDTKPDENRRRVSPDLVPWLKNRFDLAVNAAP
jgi:aminoglycoside phosphotransferase (APT) family kinase protein